MQQLKDYNITHGHIRPVRHPDLGVMVNGQSTVRHLRFLQKARLDRLELSRSVYGRWTPNVPTHPAHLILSTLDRVTGRWRTVKEVNLPYDPRVAGEGLTAETPPEQVGAMLWAAANDKPHVIPLDGLETDHLRVECDREHPVWPSHGEVNGNIINVPFGILNPLRAFGELTGNDAEPAPYQPPLSRGEMRPAAPKGMKLKAYPERVVFEGKHLKIAFALRRPLLLHLGWDALGKGQAGNNRHCLKYVSNAGGFTGTGGPWLQTLTGDHVGRLWTGEVSVVGNRVCYRRLRAVPGLTLDIEFVVEADRVRMELAQHCERPIPVLEYETWRWVWDEALGITAAAAEPTLLPGRNGDVKLPFMWAGDGAGCLSCRLVEGDPSQVRTQIESYQCHSVLTGGISLVDRPSGDACLIVPAGTRRAVLELAVDNFQPHFKTGKKAGTGIRRQWATMFACFRPELGGFSNNAVSCNCLPSGESAALIAVHTARPKHGPDPLALVRFTVERAILGGGGYGYWRNLYMEVDPAVLCAAGQVYRARPDVAWLRRIEPGLLAAVERMAASIGPDGLMLCKDLSGNSGSYRWSSNMCDVVGFGHVDAFSNAIGYRAFRNAAAMLAALGRTEPAARCRRFADGMRAAYGPCLLNPETGWVAGWRSRDGQLHDYAFTFVNGSAIAFGLLDDTAARKALRGLEDLRIRLGVGDGRLGIPCNLLPIRKEDHVLWQYGSPALPTFETYTDGSMMPSAAIYYLPALWRYGFRKEARKLAKEMDSGFGDGLFSGGHGSRIEFHSWEGLANGYEGTLIWEFAALYGIAVVQGLIQPPDPEWWPAED
jgi:hypothetical protein